MQDQTSVPYYQAMMLKQPQFPEQEQLKCPRCDSTNTKFCYYNNYNLSQPRHYCKNCRRYWTKGGALRNIPIGGGSRKNTKRSKKTHVVINPDPGPHPDLGSGSSRVSSQSQDPTQVMYGSPAKDHEDMKGVDLGGTFSSLLASNLQLGGIILDRSLWDQSLALRRSDRIIGGSGGDGGGGGVWSDLPMNRAEKS